MTIQFGKNPEYILSFWLNILFHSGEIALPISLSWWYSHDFRYRSISISVYILCFGISLEIWRWNKKEL